MCRWVSLKCPYADVSIWTLQWYTSAYGWYAQLCTTLHTYAVAHCLCSLVAQHISGQSFLKLWEKVVNRLSDTTWSALADAVQALHASYSKIIEALGWVKAATELTFESRRKEAPNALYSDCYTSLKKCSTQVSFFEGPSVETELCRIEEFKVVTYLHSLNELQRRTNRNSYPVRISQWNKLFEWWNNTITLT